MFQICKSEGTKSFVRPSIARPLLPLIDINTNHSMDIYSYPNHIQLPHIQATDGWTINCRTKDVVPSLNWFNFLYVRFLSPLVRPNPTFGNPGVNFIKTNCWRLTFRKLHTTLVAFKTPKLAFKMPKLAFKFYEISLEKEFQNILVLAYVKTAFWDFRLF